MTTIEGPIRVKPGSKPVSTRSPWHRYLRALATGILSAFAFLVAMFAVMVATDSLPPPPISNNLCLDEKLSFMRDNPPDHPNLLVVGSSVAWRNIDSGVLADHLPGARPFNGGFCALNVAQTESATPWLLSRMPTVKNVVFVVSTEDFEVCARQPRTEFAIDEADRFVFQDSWRWGFYFRYFDPVSLVRNALNIRRMRTDVDGQNILAMTRYGDAPMNGQKETLVYDAIERFDPACFEALRAMAQEARAAGTLLTVVISPLHPLWVARYDPDGAVRNELKSRIEQALEGTGARYWDGDADFAHSAHSGPDVFVDAIHLNRTGARAFTALLSENLPSDL